ncbi:MAG TPA: asparaginase [Candidatus Sulfotelmatobacter sp.]|nr:asparaginase [Candidatus Sulfotelmatobacter sp.]
MPTSRLPPPGAAPIGIAVTRGDLVESRHRVACAVVDADGRQLAAWGDVAAPVYPRSAVKALQALPLIESGAADAFGLNETELALACASHNGEPAQVAAVRAWLARLGLGEADLECGSHWPYHEPSMLALAVQGERPTAAHNNCSGKHSAMLTVARHRGEPVRGYTARAHPAQQRAMQALAEMAGIDLAAAPVGIDGCAIPTVALPLDRLALAMARFARPAHLPPARAEACRRLAAAMSRAPLMIAGHGRLDSALIEAAGGRILSKGGAEGVQVAMLPEPGIGIAIKALDGAARAREVALGLVLDWLGVLDAALRGRLADFLAPGITNRRGAVVGRVQAADAGF